MVAVELLGVLGLTLAGGLLLLWVCWKLWRELRAPTDAPADGSRPIARKTFRQAVVQIVLADVSMSLDNVLAVAGVARDHLMVMMIGLALSVALMGFAAALVARLLQRYPLDRLYRARHHRLCRGQHDLRGRLERDRGRQRRFPVKTLPPPAGSC